MSDRFLGYLKENMIHSKRTTPTTPKKMVFQKGKKMLYYMVWSTMNHTERPLLFWGYALKIAIYTLNRVPNKPISAMPCELWCGRKPNLCIWGSRGCLAYVGKQNANKLEPLKRNVYFRLSYTNTCMLLIFNTRSKGLCT